MIAYDTLRAAWRDERARHLSRYHRLPALAESGLVLGANTVIAKRAIDRWGAPDLALKTNEARILALLAVAYWRPVSPAAIGNLRRAAKALARGDRALAAIHIAHTGLEKLEQDERIAFRLFCAERLLDAGVSPRELMTGLGLDPWPLDALKANFNPDEPRDDWGRWSGGGTTTGNWDSGTEANTDMGAASSDMDGLIEVADSGQIMTDGPPPTAHSTNGPRAVTSLYDGKVKTSGWQDDKDHSKGLGYRVIIEAPDGSRTIYGHMDETTAPKEGAQVKAGDYIGDYADPTNGHSTKPHVHVQQYDTKGMLTKPDDRSPIKNGVWTTRFGDTDKSHPKPHQGIDWALPGSAPKN